MTGRRNCGQCSSVACPEKRFGSPSPWEWKSGGSQGCHYFLLGHCFRITLRGAATGLTPGFLVLTQGVYYSLCWQRRHREGRCPGQASKKGWLVACHWWWVEYLRWQNSILCLCFLIEAHSVVTSAKHPFMHIRVKLPFYCLNSKDAAFQLI